MMKPIEWRNHVQDWQRSGLTKRAYARENDLSYSQFLYWTNKPEFAPAPADLLVPVEVAVESSHADGLGRVDFPSGATIHIHDGALLADLIPCCLAANVDTI